METSHIRKRMPVSALFDPKIVVPAIGSAFVKLDPRTLMKNPVMFVLEIVTALTTVILIRDLLTGGEHIGFEFQIILWLWFTVLFANFAEAIAEGRGKAQADALRSSAPRPRPSCSPAPARRTTSWCRHQPQGRRRRPGRSRRHHPVRRRSDRRHRLGQRSGDHRRIGAGHPRIGRRPLRGDRRHAGAVRLDQRAHHGGARARPSSIA